VFPPDIPIGFVKSGTLKQGTFLELEVDFLKISRAFITFMWYQTKELRKSGIN
jgi:hypothetical protein